MDTVESTSLEIGGKQVTFETGKIARQANGSCVVRVGETVVFSSVCTSKEPQDVDFLPLRVDYQERFSSIGKTVGGFIKREGRPTDRETLVSRLIDRPLRPMFPEGYRHEVQALSFVWSYDRHNRPDTWAICAVSAAMCLSDVPLPKPLGAVRVGRIEGNWVINPSVAQTDESDLDLVLAGTEDAILMIEGYCDFLTEAEVLDAIETGHEEIKKICAALKAWQEKIGKPKKVDTLLPPTADLQAKMEELFGHEMDQALACADKVSREESLATLKEKTLEALVAEEGEEGPLERDVKRAFKAFSANKMRQQLLQTKVRCDKRGLGEVRPITIEEGLLPRAHGSALFTRGETQTMAVCTLGGENMGQKYEDLHGDWNRRFYLQYFFPPFSVGEVGRMGPAARREVGHGKLAERALQYALPSREAFPYTIRLESNITESNGSSSMASVCGGCLAMMNAGVPIKRPVAGIAMGLILEENDYAVLSDILGIEDALGDMDFKITGDLEGITAFQMDIKVEGITIDIMRKALEQAKEGRSHILNRMLEVCPEARGMAAHAPRIESIRVKTDKIGTVIGPGGKQIRSIIEETGVEIDINDEGIVNLCAADQPSLDKARKIIEDLVAEVEVGKIYRGRVTSVRAFGAFVEVLPGKEGLCHVSELDKQRVEDAEQFVKVGDVMTVKVLGVNEKGQVKLSRKATLLTQK